MPWTWMYDRATAQTPGYHPLYQIRQSDERVKDGYRSGPVKVVYHREAPPVPRKIESGVASFILTRRGRPSPHVTPEERYEAKLARQREKYAKKGK